MITIGKPYIERRGEETFLLSLLQDEVRKKDLEVWFSVSNEYGGYLCEDYADSFLLMTLLLGMNSGQDIQVLAPVSERLLHNLENTVQPLLAKANPKFRQIKITALPARNPQYGGTAVGCCCSLGVDSFASFLKNTEEQTPESYRVTHLTLFNSGQLGYLDLKGAEQLFHKSIEDLQPFAAEVGLPIVAVNTNLNEWYLDGGISIIQSMTFRTISCAMALQKLFGKYIFASSYSAERFQMSQEDCTHMESVFVPQLSTENMEVVLSQPVMNRVEKTAYISRYPITYRYLDVCWSGQMAYGVAQYSNYYDEKEKTNCGRCDKCLRTMLTLDFVGQLDKYEGQFDMDYYRTHKEWYIAKVLVNKKGNQFYDELSVLLTQKGYVPSRRVRKIMFKLKYPISIEKIRRKVRKTIKKLSRKV